MWNSYIPEILEKDEKLKRVFDEVGLLHFESIRRSPFVSLVGAIIGQKISFAQARKIRGTQFTPSDLVGKNLREILGKNHNIEVLQNVISSVQEQDITTEEGIRKLDSIRGISKWTIETTLLTSMISLDIFPSGDAFLLKRMKELYNISTAAEMKEISERWKPYRSVVTWYLWRWFP